MERVAATIHQAHEDFLINLISFRVAVTTMPQLFAKFRSMETEMKAFTQRNDYLELVQCLPLSIIKHEKQYKHMLLFMQQLAGKGKAITKGERQYFEVLQLLISDYKSKNLKSLQPTPKNVLRELMIDYGLTQAAIARLAGEYESNISAFLSGKRNLSKRGAKRLAIYFAVDPMIFCASPFQEN